MNKKLRNIVLLIGFIIGLSIAVYPAASSRWNDYRASKLVSDYKEVVLQNNDEEDLNRLIKEAEEYNKTLDVPSVPDAFSIRDGIMDPYYESLLNLNGDGMIGYIDIPAIKVNIPIYHYTTDESLQKGAGHLLGSALPVGGIGTHCVVSAHRGLPNAKLFTDLNLLVEGDVFYFHVLNQICAYEIEQILIVEPHETDSLSIKANEDLATLVTCTPYAVNTHRLLVRGHRIPYTDESYENTITELKKNPRTDTNYIFMQCLSVVVGIIVAVVITVIANFIAKRIKK